MDIVGFAPARTWYSLDLSCLIRYFAETRQERLAIGNARFSRAFVNLPACDGPVPKSWHAISIRSIADSASSLARPSGTLKPENVAIFTLLRKEMKCPMSASARIQA